MVEEIPFDQRLQRMMDALDALEKAALELRREARQVVKHFKGEQNVPTQEG